MKYMNINLRNASNNNITSVANNTGESKVKNILVLVGIILVLGLVMVIFGDKIKGLFNPISVVASVTSANLKETDGRTNVLLLGSDKRSKGVMTSVLTDTILIASVGKVDNDVVLISLPRDLWVQSPNGYHSKINAIYTLAENNQPGTGPEELKKVIQEVTGITIHYYALVTFDLFEETIDTLGGVKVTVDNGFTDYYYPIEGMENAPVESDRYEVVRFETGEQNMDGKTALKFVRSRKGDNGEGTDFARAKRQQKVIAALKDKVFSLQTLINPAKIKSLYDTYEKNVETNIDFATVQSFYLLSQQVDLSKVVSVVLDDRSTPDEGGLLYAPEDTTLYGGQYVLVPKTGDYSQIHAFVQRYLFGNK